jgi:hypothetical protein
MDIVTMLGIVKHLGIIAEQVEAAGLVWLL